MNRDLTEITVSHSDLGDGWTYDGGHFSHRCTEMPCKRIDYEEACASRAPSSDGACPAYPLEIMIERHKQLVADPSRWRYPPRDP